MLFYILHGFIETQPHHKPKCICILKRTGGSSDIHRAMWPSPPSTSRTPYLEAPSWLRSFSHSHRLQPLTASLFSDFMDLLIPDFRLDGITYHNPSVSSSFHWAEMCSRQVSALHPFLWLNNILIRSSADGHLDGCHFVVIVNGAAERYSHVCF
jgi:hypothetical protein